MKGIDDAKYNLMCKINELPDAVSSDESDPEDNCRLVSSTIVWRSDNVNTIFMSADQAIREVMSKDARSRSFPIVKSNKNSRRVSADVGERMLRLRPELGEEAFKWDILTNMARQYSTVGCRLLERYRIGVFK